MWNNRKTTEKTELLEIADVYLSSVVTTYLLSFKIKFQARRHKKENMATVTQEQKLYLLINMQKAPC